MSIDEMKLLTKLRNLGGYENMSWQQLESLFTIPSAFASTPKPEKNTLNHKAKATLRPKSTTPESLPTNTNELKKMETVKSRQLAKNTWYE